VTNSERYTRVNALTQLKEVLYSVFCLWNDSLVNQTEILNNFVSSKYISYIGLSHNISKEKALSV
jgi:hypothetical protein